ncbi:nuclear transport factor 2 family protein [Litchfieldia alkalitelluris]|uniref:nuclear transport factor 2 family protein n=1 Tax=Litchfieldia alkalitelluris TaxID=304268 RepID=UPI0009986C3A|nr:ester cyclase [Litchfieldia alkalitelluris]
MNTEQTSFSTKEIAVSFLQLVASGNIREAFQKYISPSFFHHNPFFPGDANSLMLAMEENATQNPNKVLEVKHAIQEGETVMVHSHVKQHPDDLGGAVVHIFRFEDNRIVELWDIGQAVPENSPNEKGMF